MKNDNKLQRNCKVSNEFEFCSPLTLISCGGLVVSKGIDTIHMTLDVALLNEAVLSFLKDQKTHVQQTINQEIAIDLGLSGIFAWNLQRSGTKLYPYILRNGDITFLLSTRKKGSTIPNAALQVGSISCNNNLTEILQKFDMWASALGISIVETKISRLDIYADIQTDICKISVDNLKRYITKANNRALYYRCDTLTGVQVGRSGIVCRIYDKQEEMVQKQKLDKQSFFLQKWGGLSIHDDITRVEFQLRRKVIKEFFPQKTDYKTITDEICGLWAYLTQEWLRHTSGDVDRENKNQSKAIDSDFWEIVKTAFDEPPTKITRDKKIKVIDITALKRQIRGLMFSIIAGFRVQSDDFFEICKITNQTIYKEIIEYMVTPEYASDYAAKRARAVVSF